MTISVHVFSTPYVLRPICDIWIAADIGIFSQHLTANMKKRVNGTVDIASFDSDIDAVRGGRQIDKLLTRRGLFV